MGGWLWELSVAGTRGQGRLGLIAHRCEPWWSLASRPPGAPRWPPPASRCPSLWRFQSQLQGRGARVGPASPWPEEHSMAPSPSQWGGGGPGPPAALPVGLSLGAPGNRSREDDVGSLLGWLSRSRESGCNSLGHTCLN